jgi:hypothetical protein
VGIHQNICLPEEGLIILGIYNSIGEKDATLVEEIKKAGNYTVVYRGGVVNVYSDNSNVEVVIADVDNKKIGEEYIYNLCWS